MGKRGPKPIPTAILKLRGSWIAETRDGEPQTTPSLPDPPAILSERARPYWFEFGNLLLGMGVMAEPHAPALATLCEMYADWIDLCNRKGIKHLEKKFKAWDRVMKGLSQFGMTPSSITTVRANQTQSNQTALPRLKIAK